MGRSSDTWVERCVAAIESVCIELAESAKTGVRLRGLKSARRRGLDMFTGYARAARRARLGWFRWMGGTATGSEGGERGLVASHVASRIQATRTY